jgi:nitrogen fixation protein FixH
MSHAISIRAARGRWIPWVFIGGMLIVVAANGALVYFAISSWDGVVTAHAFERGAAYNRLLAAAAAEEALGWKADITYRADTRTSGALTVILVGKDGQPVDRAVLSAEAQRPVEPGRPVPIALKGMGEGRYVGTASGLRAGQWDIRVIAARDGTESHVTRRIVVP